MIFNEIDNRIEQRNVEIGLMIYDLFSHGISDDAVHFDARSHKYVHAIQRGVQQKGPNKPSVCLYQKACLRVEEQQCLYVHKNLHYFWNDSS